jgi:hypothetical protein
VTLRNVTLLPVGIDGVFTFDDYVLSLKNQISAGFGSVNFSAANRIYIVYVDQIQDVYPYGGQGDLINDDQPDPATNANNDSRSRYSMSAYLDMPVIVHEVGHNLSAVQNSAPHSSRAGHCYDEVDLMCSNDGGSFQSQRHAHLHLFR